MRVIVIFTLLAIFSCNPKNNKSNLTDENIITNLLDEYIKQDKHIRQNSYNIDAAISVKLQPYVHYTPVYSEDGMEAPPPAPNSIEGRYANEQTLVAYINEAEYGSLDSENPDIDYFAKDEDLEHLRYQIIQSKELISKLDIKEWSKKYNSEIMNIENGWYNFYIPLFNYDSTQVYMQYDYHLNPLGGFGEGNGAVFVKTNGNWKFVRWIAGWIT